MDIFGLSALDRLFCFMIVRDLQQYLKYLRRNLVKSPAFIKSMSSFISILGEPENLIGQLSGVRLYTGCLCLAL